MSYIAGTYSVSVILEFTWVKTCTDRQTTGHTSRILEPFSNVFKNVKWHQVITVLIRH